MARMLSGPPSDDPGQHSGRGSITPCNRSWRDEATGSAYHDAPSRQSGFERPMTLQFPTIADCIGNTPLVRLQCLGGETSNTLQVTLEGNNPAGSVKDRPALSMIKRAELRGDIQPGDTLIAATSGNTGIAL